MYFPVFLLLYTCSYKLFKKGVVEMGNLDTIQDSIDYIENNLKAEISAQELADQANFSMFHYYRLF